MSNENEQPKTISLTDYYTELERLDWYYEMSDDHSAWRRGSAAMGLAQAHGKISPAHQELFEAFKAHMWSNWKKKPNGDYDYDAGREVPKPERPKVEGFRTGESNGSS